MQLDVSDQSLPAYKALASPVRLKIIRFLSMKKYNVKDMAKLLGLSEPITLRHLNKLHEAGIIEFEKSGKNKISRLKIDNISIQFPQRVDTSLGVYESEIPVGLYTDFSVEPTCGLADQNGFIGQLDEPRYFMDPRRRNAQMLWFSKGFVEYQVANFLKATDHLKMITLSAELGSEIPLSNDYWPSDITFTLNGAELGTWTSRGDFADTRGKYTPRWTPRSFNQYGTMVLVLIASDGTWIGGKRVSKISIEDLQPLPARLKLRIEVKPNAKNMGGCTIFGKSFGNYDENMKIKFYYS
ncbi:MAG: ArsR family transcriptional regulator [Sporolactobacillus sp.]|jgi:predicted transcriptional regulator|nr:ArsR family transcriptional regulator [Sporolactobacillus sp.]